MKFLNVAGRPLDFKLNDIRYQVDVNGSCDIPDEIAYAVKAQGLPLLPDTSKAEAKAGIDIEAEPEPLDDPPAHHGRSTKSRR
jgi:hypothetical protein